MAGAMKHPVVGGVYRYWGNTLVVTKAFPYRKPVECKIKWLDGHFVGWEPVFTFIESASGESNKFVFQRMDYSYTLEKDIKKWLTS